MLNAKLIKKIIKESVDIKEFELETVEGETTFAKKLSIGDTMNFRGLKDDELAIQMVLVGIVDDKGERVFSSTEEILDLPMEMVSELMEIVSSHNSEVTVEEQAKKS